MKVLVTGCAGFIGSHFVDRLVGEGYDVVGVDSLTYAGKISNMSASLDRIIFYTADICDFKVMNKIVQDECPDWIINFAAETHVDNSIADARQFLLTNILGVQCLLDICWKNDVSFFQISTDEVYGSKENGSFIESDILNPRNPYSASKAAAEHLVTSYYNTHKVPFRMVRMSNNFGPRQHNEKLIPTALHSLAKSQKIPVYGDGKNVRDWLYVKDCAQLIEIVLANGKDGETYNLTHNHELENIELLKILCNISGKDFEKSIEFVCDRPGHDFRYSISNEKVSSLGIPFPIDFDIAIAETIEFYRGLEIS